MQVETNQFQFSHGQKPRGYGLWYFELTLAGGVPQMVGITDYYATAKKAALAKARELKATRIEVLP